MMNDNAHNKNTTNCQQDKKISATLWWVLEGSFFFELLQMDLMKICVLDGLWVIL